MSALYRGSEEGMPDMLSTMDEGTPERFTEKDIRATHWRNFYMHDSFTPFPAPLCSYLPCGRGCVSLVFQ